MAVRRDSRNPKVKRVFAQNRRRTYVGDIRPAPFAVGDRGEPVRPYVGLWADADTGEVVSTVITIDRPAEALAEALVNPLRRVPEDYGAVDGPTSGAVTVADAYEIPGRAVVFDPELAATLRLRLASRGVEVQTSERIEPFENLFTSLVDHFTTATPPPAIDMSDEVLAPLCAAAERLWREKPWRYCYDEPPIGIETLDPPEPPFYAVILGRAGEVFGVALYSALEDYEAVARLDDPRTGRVSAADARAFGEAVEAAHRHRTYLVSFDQKTDVDPGYVDRLANAGWSRRYRVVPSFIAHGGRRPPSLVTEAEARRFTPVLNAVTTFCEQARDRIAELEYLPIQLVANVAVGSQGQLSHLRLTMPPDVPTKRRRRSRRAQKGAR